MIMKSSKIEELSNFSDQDIEEKVDALRRELFDLRFEKATSQLTKTHRFKETRAKLARLLTIKNERSRSNSSTSN
tara:strand:+ start:42 stop:266 length:225 start_codon:yes stop_codon:yes gene_type:complete